MKKVRLRNAEYMATLPPFRFMPGDVIEVEDDWADQLVRRGIAKAASARTETVQEKRAAMRDEQEAERESMSAGERAAQRSALMAQLSALDAQDARAAEMQAEYGGHYSDSVTREDTGTQAEGRQAADDDEAQQSRASARRQAQATEAESAEGRQAGGKR
jgi:hypothetical protein